MTTRPWIRNLFARPATRTVRKVRHRPSLTLEALEDRWVPSAVIDTEPPQVFAPANITRINGPGQAGAVVPFTPTATDNVEVASVVSTPASGSFFPVGITTVTVTATDTAGNTATADFIVTVIDTESPTI